MEQTTRAGAACGADHQDQGSKAMGAGVIGAVLSGFLASACCIGPLAAVFLGVTSAGALLALEPYRPLFAVLMAAFLGFGFYRAYWRPRTAAREGEACCTPAALRTQRVILWLATVFALVLFFVPSLFMLTME